MLNIFGSLKVAKIARTPEDLEDFKIAAKQGGVGDLQLDNDSRFLYARVILMGYDLPNGNGDAIPRFYAGTFGPSFIGKNCDENHKTDPEHKAGTVMATWHVYSDLPAYQKQPRIIGRNSFGWDLDSRIPVFRVNADAIKEPKELQLEGIARLDRELRSGRVVAEKLIKGEMDSVSQEASTAYCICPICTHKIQAWHDLPCDHLAPGSLMLRAYKVNGYDDEVLAYKIHHDPNGTGLGFVDVPAYERSKVLEFAAQLRNGTLTVEAVNKIIREQEQVWGKTEFVIQASKDVNLIAKDIERSRTATPKTIVAMEESIPEGWQSKEGNGYEKKTGDKQAFVYKVSVGDKDPKYDVWKYDLSDKGTSVKVPADYAKTREEAIGIAENFLKASNKAIMAMAGDWDDLKKLEANNSDTAESLRTKMASLANVQAALNGIASVLANQSLLASQAEKLVTAEDTEKLSKDIFKLFTIQSKTDEIRSGLIKALKTEFPKDLPHGMLMAGEFLPVVEALQKNFEKFDAPVETAVFRNHLDVVIQAVKSLQTVCPIGDGKFIGSYSEFSKKFDAWKETGMLPAGLPDVQTSFKAFAADISKFAVDQIQVLKPDLSWTKVVASNFPQCGFLTGYRRLRMKPGMSYLVAGLEKNSTEDLQKAVIEAMADSTKEWHSETKKAAVLWASGKAGKPANYKESVVVVNGLSNLILGMGKDGNEGMTKALKDRFKEMSAIMSGFMAAEQLEAKKRILAKAWLAELEPNPSPDIEKSAKEVLTASKLPQEDQALCLEVGKKVIADGGPWPWSSDQRPQSWGEFLEAKTDDELMKLKSEWQGRLQGADNTAKPTIEQNLRRLDTVLADRGLAKGLAAKFFRKPNLIDSYWTLFAADGSVAGRVTLAAASGGNLERQVVFGDKKVWLSSHLQSQKYGNDLIAWAKTFGLKAMLDKLVKVKAEEKVGIRPGQIVKSKTTGQEGIVDKIKEDGTLLVNWGTIGKESFVSEVKPDQVEIKAGKDVDWKAIEKEFPGVKVPTPEVSTGNWDTESWRKYYSAYQEHQKKMDQNKEMKAAKEPRPDELLRRVINELIVEGEPQLLRGPEEDAEIRAALDHAKKVDPEIGSKLEAKINTWNELTDRLNSVEAREKEGVFNKVAAEFDKFRTDMKAWPELRTLYSKLGSGRTAKDRGYNLNSGILVMKDSPFVRHYQQVFDQKIKAAKKPVNSLGMMAVKQEALKEAAKTFEPEFKIFSYALEPSRELPQGYLELVADMGVEDEDLWMANWIFGSRIFTSGNEGQQSFIAAHSDKRYPGDVVFRDGSVHIWKGALTAMKKAESLIEAVKKDPVLDTNIFCKIRDRVFKVKAAAKPVEDVLTVDQLTWMAEIEKSDSDKYSKVLNEIKAFQGQEDLIRAIVDFNRENFKNIKAGNYYDHEHDVEHKHRTSSPGEKPLATQPHSHTVKHRHHRDDGAVSSWYHEHQEEGLGPSDVDIHYHESEEVKAAKLAVAGRLELEGIAKAERLSKAAVKDAEILSAALKGDKPLASVSTSDHSSAFFVFPDKSKLIGCSLTVFSDGSRGIACQTLVDGISASDANKPVKEVSKDLAGQVQISADLGTDLRAIIASMSANSSFTEHLGTGILTEASKRRMEIMAVAPEGFEKVVKEIKKDVGKKPGITKESPFALAWWMKKKGYKPSGKKVKSALDTDREIQVGDWVIWNNDFGEVIGPYNSREEAMAEVELVTKIQQEEYGNYDDMRVEQITEENAKKYGIRADLTQHDKEHVEVAEGLGKMKEAVEKHALDDTKKPQEVGKELIAEKSVTKISGIKDDNDAKRILAENSIEYDHSDYMPGAITQFSLKGEPVAWYDHREHFVALARRG